MKQVLNFLMFLFFCCSYAQEADQKGMLIPVFPGCEEVKNPSKELTDCFSQKLKILILEKIDKDELNKNLKNQGKKEALVHFKFSLNKQGKIEKVEMKEGSDMNLFIHIKKAIHLINQEFTSEPASYKGEKINMNFTIPITYQVNSRK